MPGHLVIIEDRRKRRRIGVVKAIVHRGAEETLVSLVSPAVILPKQPKEKR